MRKDLTIDDAKAIAELPSVMGVSPAMIVGSFGPGGNQAVVKYQGAEANRPLIFGVSSNYDVVRNVYIDTAASSPLLNRSIGRRSPSSAMPSPIRSSARSTRSTKKSKLMARSIRLSA